MEKDNETKTILYYGKKTLDINPMLAREKAADKKIPDYRNEQYKMQPKPKANLAPE